MAPLKKEDRMFAADPILLTPGPLTTSLRTKQAMLRDWGSWDGDFKQITRRVLDRLLGLAHAGEDFVCVPMQGSGTFAVEAMIGSLLPRGGKLLVPVNGAYCQRIADICRYMGRQVVTMDVAEDGQPDPAKVAAILAADPAITHVAVVQCETTSGILNPLPEIAAVTRAAGRRLLIDAISAFGALPLDLREIEADAVAISANKCIEGVPGAGFVICRREKLEQAAGNAHSLSLDLHAQWVYYARTGQWRYTPPTHVVAAFDQALMQHEEEGGTAARGARYAANCKVLVEGMRELGFRTLLADRIQAPIIVTFLCPRDPAFAFQRLYDLLKAKGFIIYPGKITVADTFRIGCIGQVGPEDMTRLVEAVKAALAEMGVRDCAPKLAA
ncbi:MAG: 2-aminoethylphosphonate--pyruvate transaminase [Alphaproteobacteria bacterium]|nr:2-aminoethylphosphonate--pyruvate transaminase [Alphaproteobacteria bacterium]